MIFSSVKIRLCKIFFFSEINDQVVVFLVVVGFLPELECNFFVQVIICFSFEKHKFSLRKKLVNQLFLSLYFSNFYFLFSSFFILTQKHQKEVSLAQLLRLPLLALILCTG